MCRIKMRNLILIILLIMHGTVLSSTLEYICSYKVTVQSNPYDTKVHTEKNTKLHGYKQRIKVNLETETITREYGYEEWDGEKNIKVKREIVSPVSKVSRDLSVPNKLIYWYEETQAKKGIHDGQVSIFSLATWTKTTLTRSYISVISAYDVHYDCILDVSG